MLKRYGYWLCVLVVLAGIAAIFGLGVGFLAYVAQALGWALSLGIVPAPTFGSFQTTWLASSCVCYVWLLWKALRVRTVLA